MLSFATLYLHLIASSSPFMTFKIQRVYWFYRSTNIISFHSSYAYYFENFQLLFRVAKNRGTREENIYNVPAMIEFVETPQWAGTNRSRTTSVSRIDWTPFFFFFFFFYFLRGKKLSLRTAIRHDRGTSLRIDDLIPWTGGTKGPAAAVWGGERARRGRGLETDHRDCNFNANLTWISSGRKK